MREYVRHALAPPIFEGDEGRTRIAEAFNLLLDGSLLTLIAAGCVAVLAFRAAAPAIVAVVTLLFVVVLGVRASLRAGHFLLASLAWLVTLWSGTIFLALGLGGLTYASGVLYLPFVIHAGLLLRRSGALVAAGISLLSTAVLMTLGQIGSPAAVDIAGSPAIAMGLLGFMLCWTVVPMAVMLRSLSRALAEARRIVAERTSDEDLLWERESRFRSTFEQAAVGIAHVHPDGRFLRINQKFCDIVRYSPYELVACSFQDITYPDDLDTDRDLLRQVLNGERANYSREKRYVRKDGSLVWVNVTASLGRSSSGEASYLIGVIQDISDQKRAEEAVRLSEERFRTIVAEFTDGLGLFDEQGLVLEWNKCLERITGIRRDEAVGVPYYDLVWQIYPREQRNAERYRYIKDAVLEASRSGCLASRLVEFEIEPLCGGRRLLQQGIFRIGTDEGSCIAAVIRDNTERRMAEETLKLDESRLEGLLKLTQIGQESVQDIATHAMEEAVRLTRSSIGYVAFANEDESVLTMHAWSQQAMAECAITNKPIHYQVEATGLWGEVVRQRLPIITNDYAAANPWKKGMPEGHIALVRHLNVPVFDGDRIVAVAGVGNKSSDYDASDIRQVTLVMSEMWRIVQRRQVDERLRESEERFRVTFETIPDPVAVSRLDNGAYVAVNPAFVKSTGWAPEEVLSRSSEDLGVWAQETARDRFTLGLREHGTVTNAEVCFRTKDGSLHPTLVSARVFAMAGIAYVVWVVRDMTELKQIEAERAQLADQLRQAQKLESIGRLAAGVAHDFNNVLTAIFVHGETALAELEPNHEVRSHVEEILKSGERARGLTRQLLAFARRQPIETRVLSLNELVEGLAKMLRRLIGEHIDVVIQTARDLGLVKADPGQIEQVLLNLVVNASDAMPKGGTITIRTANVTAGEEEARRWLNLEPGEYVGFSVGDTGVGMTDEVKRHVFEPFFTTKEQGKGTGLGLATCFGIIRQSNGHVRFESELDQGTTFTMLLPRVRDEDAFASECQPIACLPRGSEAVLVAEDDASLRHLMVDLLAAQGYAVVEAANGHEALVLAAECDVDIDLIVTDVVMPRLNGPDWVKRLGEIHRGRKVLFVSGHVDVSSAVGAESQFGCYVLPKPFTPSEFLTQVRVVLDAQPQ